MATTDTSVESKIHFSGPLLEKQDAGRLISLATVFYNPETDSLEHYFPCSISEEEAIAMLRRFRCYPK